MSSVTCRSLDFGGSVPHTRKVTRLSAYRPASTGERAYFLRAYIAGTFRSAASGAALPIRTRRGIQWPVQNGTAGNDTLTGGALNDTLNGLGGNNSLIGGADLDILDGGTGNDTLDGGLMNDILKGGAGNDTFADSVGEDTMTGGTGNDIYRVDDVDDFVIELAGGGTDVIQTDLDNLSLADYDHVEALQLKGSAALNASGSDRSDLLVWQYRQQPAVRRQGQRHS